MSIFVIVPARNEEKNIADSLKSILDQTVMPSKIIVVLDRCTDKTEDIVTDLSKAHEEIVKIIKSDTKYQNTFMKGFVVAETVNKGLESIESFPEFLLIANADSVYSKNYIESALNIFDKDAKCGLAGYSHYSNISGSGYVIRSNVLARLGNRLKECAAEDTYLQFSVLNQGYTIKPIENVEVKLLRERGKGSITDRIRYAFAKGYASYTLGYSFGFEILRTGYWILKGRFSHIGIIFGFLYAIFTKPEKLDISYTSIPKKWQKNRIDDVFSIK